MKRRFRFLSRGSTRYGVNHDSNTLAKSQMRVSVPYGSYDAVWNSVFVGPLILDQGTKSI